VKDAPSNSNRRERKLYRLTELGRRVFEAESGRLQKLASLTLRINTRNAR
jgi:DNA-binding PadR family transcriptional regulator